VEGAVAPIVDEADDAVRGAVVAFRDISVRQAAEASIRRGERLESLGLVAAGIAHQANNLLTVILGSSEFARMDLPSDSPVVPLLDEIDTAAGTLARIADQMLIYTAASVRRTATLDLSEAVYTAAPRLEAAAAGLTSLTLDLAPGLPAIEGNADQLQQALVNLVINSAEAIDGVGGSIVVRTGLRQVTAADLKLAVAGSDRPAGAYVFLEVSDNGPGITPDAQRSMFDPFFSTKFTGRGLGLAAVHGIVRMHRAALLVSSTPGAGTAITLLFTPAA
jgi:signal transduction histidine kinase